MAQRVHRVERSRSVRLGHLLAAVPRRRAGYDRIPMFRDPEMQSDLARFGYHVTTDPVVSPDVVGQLLDACARWQRLAPPSADGRFHFSGARPPTEATEFARGRIGELLVPVIAELVDPAIGRVGPSVFQVKPSSPHSGIRAHQDPFLVNEKRSFSVSVWTALTDVDIHSGPLIVLPGSHRYARWPRVATTTDDLDGYHEVIDRHARAVPLRAGQAVLFDGALIHGSLVNRSGRTRIGASTVVLPTADPVVAPQPVEGGPPQVADVYRLEVDRATGRTSPAPTDAQPYGQVRLARLSAGPRGLDLACRLQARLAGSKGGVPVPDDISTA